MKLLLVRHAQAEPHDWSRWADDASRPLTTLGVEQITRMARQLADVVQPDALLTSPLLRAVQTAEILSSVAGWPEPATAIEITDGNYASLVEKHFHDLTGAVVMVGHEPTISAYVSQLVSGRGSAAIRMHPGTAALVELSSPDQGVLEWLAPVNLF